MALDINMRVRATDEASGVLKGIAGTFGNIMQGAASFIMANVIQRGATAMFDFAKSSIDAASNLGETYNKVGEIFEESSQGIIEWSKSSATAVGLSQQGALDAAASMAIFGKAAGLAGQELNDFATQNVGMAADMASFFNTSVEDAAQALGAAFRGEAEPIRRYGVLLNDAVLKEKALELGIISNTKNALTPQQKVLAANAVITEQLADASGDFARTSDGLANSQRILKAQMENVKTELGTAFLPIAEKVVGFLSREGIPVILEWVDSFKHAFANIGRAFEGTDSLIDGLKLLFTTFEDGSSYIGSFLEALGLSEDVANTLADTINSIVGYIMGGGLMSLSDVDLFGTMFDTLIGVKDSVISFFQFLGNWWTANGAPIFASFVQMGQSVGETFQKIVADVKPLVDEVFAKIANWMVENAPLIQAFAQTVADFWTNNLMPAILSFWNAVKPILSGLVDLILGLGKIIMQVVTGDWAGAWETLMETAVSVGEALWSAITNLLDGIAKLFGTTFDQIVQAVVNWWTGLMNQWRVGQATVSNDVATWWEGIKTSFSDAVQAVKDFVTNLWNDIVLAFQTAGLIVIGLGVMFWNAILGLFGTNVMEVRDWFVQLWADITAVVQSIGASISEWATSTWATITEWATNIWTTVVEKWNEILAVINEVWNSIVEAISSFFQPVVDAVAGIWNSIVETVSGWIDGAMEIGRNIVQGIADGISNSVSSVVSAITGVAQDAIASAKALLGIQSPSTVFAGIGQNIMSGLAQGIGDGVSIPVNAMQSATTGIVNAVPTGTSIGTGSAGGAIVVNVYIQSPMTFMDENNAVENIRKYVSQAFRQLRSEGQV